MKYKKIRLFLLGAMLLSCSSNDQEQNKNPLIIAPNGTPLIAISNYAIKHQENIEKVAGADPLKAAFASEDKDFIVAPINLGAMRYNAKPTYGLYKTLVWDNIFILSRKAINSIEDLNDTKITSFGKGSTPQIVLDTILNANDITCEVEYVDNVQIANSSFLSGVSDIVVSAQPQISAINLQDAYVISLNKFWKDVTGLDSYPQAGLFVKIEAFKTYNDSLKELLQDYELLKTDVEKSAINAETITGTFKKELLMKAIPNSGYRTIENEDEIVKAYFNKMLELGLNKQIGEKVPDDGFFLND